MSICSGFVELFVDISLFDRCWNLAYFMFSSKYIIWLTGFSSRC